MNQFHRHIIKNWYEPFLIAAVLFIAVYFRLFGPAPGDYLPANAYIERMWIP